MLYRWSQETNSKFWDEMERRKSGFSGRTFEQLPYQLWSVNKYGACADAAITGVMPPPLMEVQVSHVHCFSCLICQKTFILLCNG